MPQLIGNIVKIGVSVFAGVLGYNVANNLTNSQTDTLPPGTETITTTTFDLQSFLFALGVSLLTALITHFIFKKRS